MNGAFHAWAKLGDGYRFESWLAWDERRWTAVTVKLPRPDRTQMPRVRRALVDEARTLRALRHPGIQRLLEDHTTADIPHLVFEYVEGPTLADLLDEEGALDPRDVCRLGMQLAAALHFAHEQGVVHLDVKPTNLVIADGRAVLIDWALARRQGDQPRRGRPRGSPPYMAPEQIRRARVTRSMDLFALGAVLFEAAVNRPPFETHGDEYPQLARRADRLTRAARSLPAGLARVIDALLEPDIARRPSTCRRALEDLAHAAGERIWPPFADHLLRHGNAESAP